MLGYYHVTRQGGLKYLQIIGWFKGRSGCDVVLVLLHFRKDSHRSAISLNKEVSRLSDDRALRLLAISGNRWSRSISFVMMRWLIVQHVLLTVIIDFFLIFGRIAVMIDVTESRRELRRTLQQQRRCFHAMLHHLHVQFVFFLAEFLLCSPRC